VDSSEATGLGACCGHPEPILLLSAEHQMQATETQAGVASLLSLSPVVGRTDELGEVVKTVPFLLASG
jgi:hypothetical protein